MFTKDQLLGRYNFIELNRLENREREKKARRRSGLIIVNDDGEDDNSYVKNVFPIQSDFQVEEYTAPISGENELNDLVP